MAEHLNAWQVCKAAGITRSQLNQWLVRGHFRPKHEPEIGKGRTYSMQEAVSLGTFAELIRLGIPHEVAARHCQNLHGFKNEPALLVVFQGPIELIPSNETAFPVPTTRRAIKFYDPDRPLSQSEIIRLSQLAAYANNIDVHSLVVVNLDHVEARAKSAVQSASEVVVKETDDSVPEVHTKRRRKR